MEYTIRQTVEADLPAILELIHEFHEEKLEDMGLICDDEVARELMPKLVDTSLVMLKDDKVIGIIAGFVTHHVVNKEPLFQEVIWYVSRQHRLKGIKLLDAMETWCMEHGIFQMVMVNMGDYKTEQFAKLYKSRGYKLLEVQYLKELEG